MNARLERQEKQSNKHDKALTLQHLLSSEQQTQLDQATALPSTSLKAPDHGQSATREAYGGLAGIQASTGPIQQKGNGSAGTHAEAGTKSKVTGDDHSVSATAEAGASAGAHATGHIKLPAVELQAEANVETASKLAAKAGAKMDKTGVAAEADASASVGAHAGAKGSAKVGGVVGAGADGEAHADAGAKAAAKGKVSLKLDDVSASGALQAHAGASAGAGGSAGVEVNGKRLFAARGKVEASVGAGGKIGGEFSFKDGKLVIGGELGACVGVGGGVDVGIEVDFGAIGDAIIGLFK